MGVQLWSHFQYEISSAWRQQYANLSRHLCISIIQNSSLHSAITIALHTKKVRELFPKEKTKRIKIWTVSRSAANPAGFHCIDVLPQRWANSAARLTRCRQEAQQHCLVQPSCLPCCASPFCAGMKAWLLVWGPPVTALSAQMCRSCLARGSAEGRMLQAMPRSSFSSAPTQRPNTAPESKATREMTSPAVRKQLCGGLAMLNLCHPCHPNCWASAHCASSESMTLHCDLAEHLQPAVLSETLQWLFKYFTLSCSLTWPVQLVTSSWNQQTALAVFIYPCNDFGCCALHQKTRGVLSLLERDFGLIGKTQLTPQLLSHCCSYWGLFTCF